MVLIHTQDYGTDLIDPTSTSGNVPIDNVIASTLQKVKKQAWLLCPFNILLVYTYMYNVGKKRSRCDCSGCSQADCGDCSNCRDMKRFGGPGKKKEEMHASSMFKHWYMSKGYIHVLWPYEYRQDVTPTITGCSRHLRCITWYNK